MDASSRAARIDLICSADARHLARSLQQALTMRGLQVTLRDFAQPARAPIGVAVLTEDGPTAEQWHGRLAAYTSRSMIAFEQAMAPAGQDVFILSGWPSRRADQVLSELVEYLVRELQNGDSRATRRPRESRDSGPLVALGLVVALIAGMIYLLAGSADNEAAPADPEEMLASPEAIAPGLAPFDPAEVAAPRPEMPGEDDRVAPSAVASGAPGAVIQAGGDQEHSIAQPLAGYKTVSCLRPGIAKVPPAHLFAWRPVLQAPEVPRIWAMVQPQYYLPEHGDCA